MAEVVIMPKLGFDMAGGILVRWVVGENDVVEKGQILAEIETDKATVEVEAMVEGVVHRLLASEGDMMPIGSPIAVIGAPDEQIDIDALVAEAETAAEDEEVPAILEAEATPEQPFREIETVPIDEHLPDGVRASPVARRLARDRGIDLRTLSGTGTGGRIVKRDVEAALKGTPATIAEVPEPSLAPSLPSVTERRPMSKLRAIIGRRMAAAKQQSPHFYVTADVDAKPMMSMRSEMNAFLPEEEKLSVNDFIVKAAALSLRSFPNLNTSYDTDHIVHHADINIGIAVAVENGLLTVVVKNADRKSLQEISNEARVMITRTRSGHVRPNDIEGSTFTVSNLGMFDVDHFIAIINPPESAILAVGSVQNVPVVEDGQVVPGLRIQCTVSGDHRVTDGAEVARWLQTFRGFLEHPIRLML
jgi:pyruvate dehydrogenase E2 component (dihydrolipoamide acetyltransferase)